MDKWGNETFLDLCLLELLVLVLPKKQFYETVPESSEALCILKYRNVTKIPGPFDII